MPGGRDGLGERLRQLRRAFDQEEGQALGPLFPDPGEALELLNQIVQGGGARRLFGIFFHNEERIPGRGSPPVS